MILPKDIKELYEQKSKYLTSQRGSLQRSVKDMQEKLFNRVLVDIVSELDTDNGKIKQTRKNIRLINELNAVYDKFNRVNQFSLIQNFAKSLLGINKLNTNYFKAAATGVPKSKFTDVVNKTNDFMTTRIGIGAKNEIVEGGFLDSFIKDRTVVNDMKNLTIRSVTGQMDMSEYKILLKHKVIGTETNLGGFERYYNTFAYDQYNEYDRAYGSILSKEFKLNYAVYTGGLIEDSREFCIEHNSKVYTREEISKFGEWHDSKGQIPNYIAKFPGYNPEINCGGWGCRHELIWIDKITAYKLRPELKELEATKK
jgi:hypothetical protein